MSPEQQWNKAAAMVIDKLRGHDATLEKIGVQLQQMQKDVSQQLTHIQLALVSAGNETNGRIKSLEKSVEDAALRIGSAETCKDHSASITRLVERVDQHAQQQREKFEHVNLNKKSIDTLFQKHDEFGRMLTAVDKEGSNQRTEWRTVVWIVGASALGSGAFWGAITALGGFR